MELVIAAIGVKAIYFLFGWLISSIVASYLSGRKGYGERIGLASGLILAPIGALIWAVMPAKPESDWKVVGPFGRPKVTADPVAETAAHGRGTGGAGSSSTGAVG